MSSERQHDKLKRVYCKRDENPQSSVDNDGNTGHPATCPRDSLSMFYMLLHILPIRHSSMGLLCARDSQVVAQIECSEEHRKQNLRPLFQHQISDKGHDQHRVAIERNCDKNKSPSIPISSMLFQ